MVAIGAGVTVAATIVDLAAQSENAPRTHDPTRGAPILVISERAEATARTSSRWGSAA